MRGHRIGSLLLRAVLTGIGLFPAVTPTITLAGSAHSRAAATTTWSVRDMGLTALTHDTVCNQYSQATMNRLVGYIAQFHANYASDDAPYDDASGFGCTPRPLAPYDYLKAWADTLHAAGLHVIFRGNWNHWAGDYGEAKLSYSTNPSIPYESSGGLQAVLSGSDTYSYIGQTYQWVLRHPDVFRDGDIFEPFGEPQNNGSASAPSSTSLSYCPKGVCQFPSVSAFNQWLSDFTQADQSAFQRIGKNVRSGWFGLAGDSYTYVTPATMARSDTYNMDLFTNNFTTFTSLAQTNYNVFGKPLVLEWGDFQDGGAEPATANATDKFLGWLAQQPYVAGVEYWQLTGQGTNGPEAVVDFSTGTMTQAGQMVAKWFGAMSGSGTTSGGGSIGYVQSTARMGTGSSLATSYGGSAGSGNLLVGLFRTNGGTTVRDNLNGAWTLAVSCGVASIWYVASAKAGSTTVTLSSTSSGPIRMAISEYSGAAKSSPLDAVACNQGSNTAVSTAGTASTGAGELAFAGVSTGSYPIAVTRGSSNGVTATVRAQMSSSAGTVAIEDVTATTAGSQNAWMTMSAPGGWTAGVAVFKHS